MIKHDFWFSLDLDLVYLFSSLDSNSSFFDIIARNDSSDRASGLYLAAV